MSTTSRVRQNWLKMYAEAENTAKRFPVKSIARYKNPPVEFVLECISKSTPIILMDVMNEWRSATWNFEYLQEKFGDVILTSSNNRDVLLGEHIQTILDGTCRTTGGIKLPQALRDEIDLPTDSDRFKMGSASIFLGTVGGVTPLHRDAGNGLNAHIIGRKAWTLLSPDRSELLYPRFSDAIAGFQVCDVDLTERDFHHSLLIHEIQPLTVVVKPREVILVPSGWFHEVKLLEASLSIAFPVFAAPIIN